MKLAIVSQHYNHFVKDQVNEVSKHVDTVNVFVSYNRLANIAHYLPLDNLQQHKKETRIKEEKKPENVNVHEVPLIYLPVSVQRRFLGVQTYRKLRKVATGIGVDFDLIHSHITWPSGYAAQKLSEKYSIPHVLTVHENHDWLLDEYNSKNNHLKQAWRQSDKIIRVNNSDISYLSEFNNDVEYVPNGYNTKYFEPISKKKARKELDIPLDKDMLFSLGNLIERKGYQNIIPILDDLESNNLEYYLAGHGPMRKDLQKLIDNSDVSDIATLLGYLPKAELKYWMSACDAFIHPSYSESFGLVQLEAMACGSPVIAAQNTGSKEVVCQPECGILIDCIEDEKEVISTINEALIREWSRKEIINHASNYTIGNVCSQITKIYQDCLNSYQKISK